MEGDNQDELPSSWATATIGDLLGADGIFSDGDWVESKDQDPDGGVRLIQLADLGDGHFVDASNRFLTEQKARELNCTFLRKKDILVARMPDPLGRACLFPLDREGRFVTVVDVCVVRPGHELIDRKFLTYALNSPVIRVAVDGYKSGSTRKRISRKNLGRVQIPIAPANEQRRIVAKLEELLSELDNGVESLQTARGQLDLYRQSLLKHAFEGRLTADWREDHGRELETPDQIVSRLNRTAGHRYQRCLRDWKANVAEWEELGEPGRKPSKPKEPRPVRLVDIADSDAELPDLPGGWAWVRLGDISDVTGGLTKNPRRTRLERQMKYLRVANVYADQIHSEEIHEIGVTQAEARKVTLRPGDMLVVEGNGSISQIGRVAIWDGQLEECGHQNHLIRVRLGDEARPRFALLFLLSPTGRDLIVREASSTSGLHTLSLAKVSSLLIPVASAAEEAEVIARLDAKLSLVDNALREIDNQLARSQLLRQAVLRKAFAGKLVPQDPQEEPAAALLERIRADRDAESNSKKKRKAAS